MSEPKKKPEACPPKTDPGAETHPEGLVRCRRVDAVYSALEHAQCPYCYGSEAQIATGDHSKFCDFRPGQDPVCFGFPDDKGRYRSR